MKRSGNTILVTGGGSGIGRALAQRLHDLGNRVIVTGRRIEALQETVAGRENLHAAALDVGDGDSVRAFAQDILSRHPELNILVNNAGIMRFEPLDRRRDLKDAEETVATNLLGPIRLIDAFIEHLAGRADSAVINVTSGLAFVPLIDAPTYSATKAALHFYTAALREELKGRVEVIELAPPAVQTGLTPGQESRPGYQPLDEFMDEVMARLGEQPTPAEILVERVRQLRFAERENRFDSTLTQLNQFARQARHAQPG